MAVLEVRRTSQVKAESAYLRDYRRNVTSQVGEDGIIEKIFEIIGKKSKWCVEFGAWDGRMFSNTWRLLNQDDWHGVLIEDDHEKFRQLTENYAGKQNVALLEKKVAPKGPNALDNVLNTTDCQAGFDLLCIDVDGMDWYIWGNLFNYRPRVVVIEFNHSIPNHICYIQSEDPAKNRGCSLLALIDLAEQKGYELVATTDSNAFFVTKEEFAPFGIADNSIDAMHFTGELESFIFQLYDGTLVLCGNGRLLWHQIPIYQEDIQVLPHALRTYNR